jgi:hypothetical protein
MPITSARTGFAMLIGVVMVIFGAFIALRPIFVHGPPLTPSRWLDVVFALFFLLRGLMNIRSARRGSTPRTRGRAP